MDGTLGLATAAGLVLLSLAALMHVAPAKASAVQPSSALSATAPSRG